MKSHSLQEVVYNRFGGKSLIIWFFAKYSIIASTQYWILSNRWWNGKRLLSRTRRDRREEAKLLASSGACFNYHSCYLNAPFIFWHQRTVSIELYFGSVTQYTSYNSRKFSLGWLHILTSNGTSSCLLNFSKLFVHNWLYLHSSPPTTLFKQIINEHQHLKSSSLSFPRDANAFWFLFNSQWTFPLPKLGVLGFSGVFGGKHVDVIFHKTE